MADVSKFSPILAKWEGGFVNDPADRGGATNKGVTLATFKAFYGSNKTADDLKRITDDQYNHILKVGYWDKCKADEIKNQSVANFIVDFAYNAGNITAIKKMQKILKVVVDGKCGPKTISALNAYDQKKFFEEYRQARVGYYNAIVKNNPSQSKFLKGWLRRTNDYKFVP